MAFDEKTKLKVKEKAAFSCCRCQSKGIQIHHIMPQELGGSDHIDNAAPLCPSCHDYFGDNPKKRKEITQMRDWWYKQVENRFSDNYDIKLLIKTVEDIRNTVNDKFQKLETKVNKMDQELEVGINNVDQREEDTESRKETDITGGENKTGLSKSDFRDLIVTSYEDIIMNIGSQSVFGDSNVTIAPAGNSSNFKLSLPITAELVHKFLSEKHSLENNYKIKYLDYFKQSGLLTYWIAKLKPILILKDVPNKTEMLLNEHLAVSVAVGIIYAAYDELILTQELVDELLYSLRYKNLEASAISAIYKASLSAIASNQKDKKVLNKKKR